LHREDEREVPGTDGTCDTEGDVAEADLEVGVVLDGLFTW